jgi:hypothetical protein
MYVAGPYSADTDSATELNIQAARHVGRLVARKGWIPLIPHGNTYHFDALIKLPQSFWIEGTLNMMERCDAVVMVDGWESSTGATGEHKRAHKLSIPIFDSSLQVPQASDFLAQADLITPRLEGLLALLTSQTPPSPMRPGDYATALILTQTIIKVLKTYAPKEDEGTPDEQPIAHA